MRLHWIALSGVLFACGTGPGGGATGGALGEDPGATGVGDENPGATGVGDEDPGGSGGPGQGGGGNVGGDGGTGNVGQGGSGGGDCNSICTVDCGQSAEICGPLCANATPDQLTCAQAALPDCSAASNCFLSGTGGTSGTGGEGGLGGTGGGSGTCTAPECAGCADLCATCICSADEATCISAGVCG